MMFKNKDEKYYCSICDRYFKHKENLTLHNKIKHLKIIKVKCNLIAATVKKKCPKCGREVTIINFNKHYKACKGIINKNYTIEDSKYICNFCGKSFKKQGIKTHIWRCHTNKGKIFNPNDGYKKGTRIAWNKGLTKETDYRILRSSITFKNNYKLGKHKKAVAKDKESWKHNISIGINKAIQNNPDSYNGHYNRGFVKEYIYKGIKLLGSWELKFAIWCDKNNIKWIKNKDQFKYILDDKEHIYFPDFYLLDLDEYIEIKGFETDKDILKWNQFPKDKKLKILKFKELQELGVLNIISKEDLLQFKG